MSVAAVSKPYRPRAKGAATIRIPFNLWGLAIVGTCIYVIGLQSSEVQVYADNPPHFDCIDSIRVEGLKDPTDIVSCDQSGLLYIADANLQNRICLIKVTYAGEPIIM